MHMQKERSLSSFFLQELIRLAKDLRAARERGEANGMTLEEIACKLSKKFERSLGSDEKYAVF